MEKIEGHSFAAIVNLASDLRTFLRILASQPEVHALAAAMRSDDVTLEVFRRVTDLARSPSEEPYEHPADAAMAAYLWLLDRRERELSEIAAEMVLGCERCWWSKKLAEQLRDTARFRSATAFATPTVSLGGTVNVDYTAHASAAVCLFSTLDQLAGLVNRAEPVHPVGAVTIYPLGEGGWGDFSRNQGAESRITEVATRR
jgi:hypothetical protein